MITAIDVLAFAQGDRADDGKTELAVNFVEITLTSGDVIQIRDLGDRVEVSNPGKRRDGRLSVTMIAGNAFELRPVR